VGDLFTNYRLLAFHMRKTASLQERARPESRIHQCYNAGFPETATGTDCRNALMAMAASGQ